MINTPKARSRGYKPGERPWTAYLYILPGFIIYALFVLWPIADTIRYSFYEWSGFSTPSFIGLDNYIKLYSDEIFRIALVNNLWFIVFYTVFPIVIGLFLTALMTRRRMPGLTVFRTGLFMPYVMAMVVVGVVWRWIYNPATGPLNQALRAVGLDVLARPWLGDFDLALPAVGVIGTWVQFGFCMVLFIAGVQRIDEVLYDAAKLDGANEWYQFWYITLPGLRNEISVAMVTTLIAALRIFDIVFVTTRGGPGNQTMVVALHIYRNAFAINRVGYAAAIAVVLTIVIVIISIFVLTLRQKWVEN
ncbi:MAG: sugar ABC transporter permease [Anaerolineae bacterium]|nr:sugar ABC transporter permease [Anaerolineae bacterium]